MSYSSPVEVDGRKMTVICDAAQLPISTGASRRQKSREVRRHLARTRTKYCFAVSSAGEGIEVWWSAEERGVSIAASLERWYSTLPEENEETVETPDDCVVILSFDKNLYLAEFVDGLVKTERVVDEKIAQEHLDRYRAENRVMHGFAAGRGTGLAERYVELKPLPFEFGEHRFERAFAAFLRHRLWHPMAVAPVLAVAAAAVLSQFDMIALWDRFTKDDQTDSGETQEPAVPIVSHAGGIMLRELVRFMRDLDVLYGDGLQRLEFTPPSGIVLSGRSPEYPSRAKVFADQRRGWLRWNSAGWVIDMDIAIPDMTGKTPMQTEALLQNMSRGWPALGLVEGPIAGHINTTRFSVDQGDINTFDLMDIAQRLDGYPAVIRYLSCKYANYRLSGCEISIETKTL